MKKKSKKNQIITSLKNFIDKNQEKYNGIIPLNDLEYTIDNVAYFYESPYSTNLYEDKVAWFYIRDNYDKTRVGNLSNEEYTKTIYKMHGNLHVIVV
jgi:hypothetical protein